MSDLAELIRKAMEHRLADVRTAMPVRVKSYDVTAQTVDVIPLVREITETDEGDVEEALPVIPSVPVAFPRAGGFFVTFPIVPGDTGQVVICDRSIDQWRTRGSDSFTPDHGFSIHPLDKRRHGLAGAVFYPGLSDSLSALADAHATDMVLGKDGGSSIHIKPSGEIHVGSAPTDFVALAALAKAELDALKTTIDNFVSVYNGHIHITTATVSAGAPGILAAPAATGTPHGTVGGVAATKVKAD